MTNLVTIILLLSFSILVNAGPVSCGVVCGTCCSAEWWYLPIMIPACIGTCGMFCIPIPIPAIPVPAPSDPAMLCQIAGAASLLLPIP